MRTNLNATYDDKDIVKKLGAKWDVARQTWYVENVEKIHLFLPWIDDKLKQPTKSKPLKHPKFKKPKRNR